MPPVIQSAAIGTIGVYRRYLSPCKGYRCANNVLHDNGSCSDFALSVFHIRELSSTLCAKGSFLPDVCDALSSNPSTLERCLATRTDHLPWLVHLRAWPAFTERAIYYLMRTAEQVGLRNVPHTLPLRAGVAGVPWMNAENS
jgi:hypothetical protein